MYGKKSLRTVLAGSVCALAMAGAAHAQDRDFNVPAGDLQAALDSYAAQAGVQLLYKVDLVKGVPSKGAHGVLSSDEALAMLLTGTGLEVRRHPSGAVAIVSASDPQSGSAAGDGADSGTVQALIVTAQKKEEAIQDVPIAISAFTEKALEEQKIEGGFDLLKAIPNVTFSKNNFTSYNFSIRGIGTKAISATTDPGVAVSFNNIALIQNRLFEQEYFDVERVEVLRGPQGTLYGRNATAGVINVISAKPNMTEFRGSIKGEVGNYHAKRIVGMVNLPLIEDKLAIRIAGAMTDRAGYDYNSVTKHAVNGRDLWSTRLTVGFNPTERIRSNFIWERFNEDDDRSRTGKQLCHRDPGPVTVGPVNINDSSDTPERAVLRTALFSQGCKPGNLYEDAAFGTPNGLALPFVFAMLAFGSDCGEGCFSIYPLGYDKNNRAQTLIKRVDPYGGMMQSRDLHTIASFRDPVYRANADVVELNFDIDLAEGLILTSQTAYDKDQVYSFQDFNRFNTVPIFTDTSTLTQLPLGPNLPPDGGGPSLWKDVAPGGIFCDPQLGCSNTLAGFDISKAKAEQFSQEVRLQSNFDGPVNFSLGANYTKFSALIDYYVFYNLITAYAMMLPFNQPIDGVLDISQCKGSEFNGAGPPVPTSDRLSVCPYIDPNPIESINGEGHNYFRSKNPYRLESAAAFGEIYWQIDDRLKLTAGLRYTDDKKIFRRIPSQVLLAPGLFAGGTVSRGYPEKTPIKQHWGEWTGRLGIDWKPELSFTDRTLLYAFYSRGYKGGGANPPQPGFATIDEVAQQVREWGGIPEDQIKYYTDLGVFPILKLNAAEYGPTFEPEFVNAYEVGSKNTLLDGALVLNTGAFFYDYKDYQVSQIRDRTAVNENFDAKVWGAELESVFSPSKNLQVIFNLGYLQTRIADGETSIDIMNRTQGDPRFVLVKPWAQLPSNCVVPVGVADDWLLNRSNGGSNNYGELCGLGGVLHFQGLFSLPRDPETQLPYDKSRYPILNGGAGLKAQLGGNELPNSPHWTMNLGAQYGFDFLDGWRATVRGDAYWQSQSWARVYNDNPYDKLHGWYNVNLSVWLERPEDGLKIEFYAKNLLDKTPITDAFLNSDDTALTTNVFVLDPRLLGLSIKKEF